MNERKLLMPFFMLGQYDETLTLDILHQAVKAGSDYLELGIPHTDPLADGVVLREAAEAAIKRGMTPKKAIALAGKAAEQNKVPVYMLIYLNTLFGYGVEAFIEDAIEAGIEGLIIPDLPLEAQQDIRREYDFGSLTLAAFTSPTSGNRLQEIVDGSDGLIYSVNYTGITGSDKSGDVVDERVRKNYDKLKALTDRPILSGFGIDGPVSARNAVKSADGVIIGTKLCQICNASKDSEVAMAVHVFLCSIRKSI